MDLKCSHPNCNSLFYWSGRGRQPHLCIPHRIELNRKNSIIWHHKHYRQKGATLDPSTPLISPDLYIGPGLPLSMEIDFNAAITRKAETLNKPIDYVKNTWLFGQAGREFVQSFLHPDRC